MEEAGEVFNAVQFGQHHFGSNTDVLFEIGDVLWYAVSFAMEVGFKIQWCRFGMPDAWPKVSPVRVIDAHVLLLQTVAKLSGRVKKSLRGDGPLVEFAHTMQGHLEEVWDLCAHLAANHGASLSTCAAMNVRKLAGRLKTNSTRGDGAKRRASWPPTR